MTESEVLLESTLNELQILYERIPEDGAKSPDYYVYLDSTKVVVEVKQIDPNKDERAILAKDPENWGEYDIFHWDRPGERVRSKIKKAIPQLKSRSSGLLPTLLILYKSFEDWPELLDEYSIRVAMFGEETIIVSNQAAPGGGAKVLSRWYGKRKSCSDSDNTSLSAIAILSNNNSPSLLHKSLGSEEPHPSNSI